MDDARADHQSEHAMTEASYTSKKKLAILQRATEAIDTFQECHMLERRNGHSKKKVPSVLGLCTGIFRATMLKDHCGCAIIFLLTLLSQTAKPSLRECCKKESRHHIDLQARYCRATLPEVLRTHMQGFGLMLPLAVRFLKIGFLQRERKRLFSPRSSGKGQVYSLEMFEYCD